MLERLAASQSRRCGSAGSGSGIGTSEVASRDELDRRRAEAGERLDRFLALRLARASAARGCRR